MYRFVLLETLTTLPLPFHPLCWSKSVLLRPENYFEFSSSFPCGGQPNRLGRTKCNAFVLTDFGLQAHHRTFLWEYAVYSFWWSQNYYHSFQTQSDTTFLNNGKCCLQKCCCRLLQPWRYLLSGITDSRDCSPFLYVTSTLSMAARERISNENNVHFILFSIGRANQSIIKIFLKMFLSLSFSQILQIRFFLGLCKNIRHLRKIKR